MSFQKSTEIIYGPNRWQIVYLPQLLKLEVKVALPGTKLPGQQGRDLPELTTLLIRDFFSPLSVEGENKLKSQLGDATYSYINILLFCS
jgi:hypothetical protein